MAHTAPRDAREQFLARVERALGTPEAIEHSPSGRTIVRYQGMTVSEHAGTPIACKFREGRALFAAVGEGALKWGVRRPHAGQPRKRKWWEQP